MPRFYTVSKAFQGKDRETGEPEVINTKGGPAEKWLVQVEDQPIQGWISILKKPGNKVEPGDKLYGIIEENNYGRPQFTRMQAPQDGQTPQRASAPAPAGPGSLESKVDRIIAILEAARWYVEPGNKVPLGQEGPKPATTATEAENADDAPLDLSQIGY